METEAQRGARDLPSRAALIVKGARTPLCLPLGINREPWLDPFPSALQLVLPGALATCPLPSGTEDIRRELCPHPQVRGCSVKTLQCVGRMSPVSAWLGPRARAPCLGSESLSEVHARQELRGQGSDPTECRPGGRRPRHGPRLAVRRREESGSFDISGDQPQRPTRALNLGSFCSRNHKGKENWIWLHKKSDP